MTRKWMIAASLLIGVTAALVLGSTCGALAQAPKCEPDKVAAKYPGLAGKTVKLATDAESPPYSFRDPKDFNNIVGIDVDMARAATKCIGVPMTINTGAWSGLLPSVIAGQNDMMWDDLYYTAERAKQVDYVVYMTAGTGGLVKKGNPKHITSFEDICGHPATAGLGTVEEAALRDQSKKCTAEGKQEITILTYPDIPSGTRLIQNDRADVMCTDLALVDQLAHDNPTLYERGIKVISDFNIGVAIKKDNQDLVKAILDAMKALQAEGTQKTVFQKYSVDTSLIIPVALRTK